MADLMARVYAGVGAPGDRYRCLLARGHGQRRFNLPLDGAQARLGRPPAKVSAVVTQVEAQAPHAHSSHARTPPIMPASLGTTMTSSPMRCRFDAVIRFELPPPK